MRPSVVVRDLSTVVFGGICACFVFAILTSAVSIVVFSILVFAF
jgi:hypothetical protein